MSEELKPCPFCGGSGTMRKRREVYGTFCCAECLECGAMARGVYSMDDERAESSAEKIWNRRAERTCTLEWRDNGDGYPPSVRCSACGRWLDAVADVEDVAQFEFCPMCGARIKEGEA